MNLKSCLTALVAATVWACGSYAIAANGPKPTPNKPTPVKPVPNKPAAPSPSAMEVVPEPPELGEEAYLLMNYETGQILISKNADKRIIPASLTKMMTSYVIGQEIQAGRLHKEDMVTISDNAWSKKYGDSSKMFIEVGKQVSVGDLNLGIIIQSGNDACIAMAEHIAGSEDAFANLMNEWAKYIGMNDSHFVNSHGLYNENHYSTAYDMAVLGRALIHDLPEEYAIYSQKEFTFNNIKQINRNRLLWDNSLHFDGIKTGHLSQVGYNLVASAVDDATGFRLISVVIGAKSEAQRAEDSKKLLTYGFRFYKNVPLAKANQQIITKRVWYGTEDEASLGTVAPINVTVPRNRVGDIKMSVKLDDDFTFEAPLKAGTPVGKIIIRTGDEVVYQTELVVIKDVEECGWFGKLWDWLVKFITGLFS